MERARSTIDQIFKGVTWRFGETRKTRSFTRGHAIGTRGRRARDTIWPRSRWRRWLRGEAAESPTPGGFVESATGGQLRARVKPPLPARGPFMFPEPYNTTGVRLTNAE